MSNRARATSGAAPFSWRGAILAVALLAVAEVFAMYLTMTVDAQGNAVANIKAQVWILGPLLDMVSVDGLLAVALLTGVVITLIYSLPPFLQLWAETCTLPFQRLPVFIGVGPVANAGLTRAMARAINLLQTLWGSEHLIAGGALGSNGRVAMGPAHLRAVLRGGCTMGVCKIPNTAKLAYESYLAVSAHTCIIPDFRAWVGIIHNVILKRWEAETGKTAALIEVTGLKDAST